MSDSPRTAEKIARSRAFLMMSSAEHTSMAMKQDKAWEKGLTIYEDKKKAQDDKKQVAIVRRQQELAHKLERDAHDHREEEDSMRVETIRQITETQRQRETAELLSTRSVAALQKTQYNTHVEQIKMRQAKAKEQEKLADEKAKLLAARDAAATKRVVEQKKAQAAKLAEARMEFESKRELVKDKSVGDSLGLTKRLKDFRKKEEAEAKRLAEYEQHKRAEIEQRARDNAQRMHDTVSARLQLLEDRHSQNEEHWDDMCALTSARLTEMQAKQQREAATHNARVRARMHEHAEVKAQQDKERLANHMSEALASGHRIATLGADDSARRRWEEKQKRDDFFLKSRIEALNWEASVKKLNPASVRSGLAQVKAPLPKNA